MSVSLRVTGTWAELIADGSVAIPATPQAGDRMYLFARWKDFSVTATVANWTELIEFADGSTTSGNGTGSVKVGCWYRDWQSGDVDPAIDFSAAPENASVVIMVMAKGADDVWLTPVAVTAAMTNWTTTSQIVSASSTVAVKSDGVVMGLIGLRDDSATMTRPTTGIDDSAGAVTWNGNYVESPATHHSTTTGDDGAADLGYRLVTTGATATLRMTGTISAAETGSALWVVQGISIVVTPGITTLTSATFAPSLRITAIPAVTTLSVTSFAPRLESRIALASTTLSLTTFAPVLNQTIVPIVATLILSGFASSLHERTEPSTVSLSLTPFAPTLTTVSFVIPATSVLIITSYTVSLDHAIIPATISLAVSAFSPSILPFNIIYLDPGGDATQAIGHFNQLIPGFGTDVTFDTSQKVVGVGSYRFDSNANQNPAVRVLNVLGNQRRLSWYWRYDSVPDVSEVISEWCEDNAIYSDGGFANPGFLSGDDDAYATATPARNAGQGSKCIPVSPLDDVLPDGAAIDVVKIIYERKYDTDTSVGISRVKWRIDGEEGPDHDNADMPLTDMVVEVDVTADRFWERKDLLAGAFELIAEARRGDTDIAHTQSWDFLKVEVVYHPANTILALANSSDGQYLTVTVTPRGGGVALRLIDSNGNAYDGITQLATDTDYRISLSYDVYHSDFLNVNLYVNGIQELSIDEIFTLGILGSLTRLHYGWLVNPGVDHVCWFDQLYIDDGDDLTDPGNVLMTAKLPTSTNENEWDDTGGTGAVNERPLSIANYVRQTSTFTPERQTYSLQAADEGDIDLSGETLVGFMGWAWARVEVDEFWDLHLVVNGANVDRTNQLSTTASLLRHGVASTSYPSDAAGIGMGGTNEAIGTFLYDCGAVEAYKGPLNPDILLERQEVNNETLNTIVDDLRADPPDSYEVCCQFDDFDGTVEIVIHSLDQDGGSLQKQPGLNAKGRVRITPGVEVRLDVTVVGVTNLQIWRRINID